MVHDKSFATTSPKNISGGSTTGSISSPQKGIKRSSSEPRETKPSLVPAEDAEVEVKQPPPKKKKKAVAANKETISVVQFENIKQEVKIKNEKPDNHKIKKKQKFSTPKPPKTLFKYFMSLKSFETAAHASNI